ncbi:hypothetical protein BHM03_00037368 [Ensete ventricosum]|nr:hypothetical protein BHM03_00037368 [Ensete ventricosum]
MIHFLCTVDLREQQIWTEIGESEKEKDRMLSELEKECMQVYRRKVDEAKSARARLHQSLVSKEAEVASLMALLGEQRLQLEVEKATSLKGKLASVNPILENLQAKKEDRVKQFSDIWYQIEKLNVEITGFRDAVTIEEDDLSTRKLTEYQTKLRSLQKEKLQDATASLLQLWNLMDSSEQERRPFEKVTSKFRSPENDVMCPGLVDPSELLTNIEMQIEEAKEQSMTRKEIIDRVNKWLFACEEENWLEDYNKDWNRYSAGRGGHLNLKRAEKARVIVSKIPAYGSKSTLKPSNSFDRKTNMHLTYGYGNGFMTPIRRISAGGATPELLTPRSHSDRYNSYFKEARRLLSAAPLNLVAVSKEDAVSLFGSVAGSGPGSPHT